MTTPAHVAHQSPGRIRLQVPSRRGDLAFFNALSAQLAQSEQVSKARANPAAASLVVEYAGPVEPLLADIRQAELELTQTPAAAVTPRLPGQALAQSFNGSAQAFNPMFMAGAVMGLVGIIQTLRGEIMVPALSAFWYAAGALQLAHSPAPGNQAAGTVQASLPVP